jgi:hypothetical protein
MDLLSFIYFVPEKGRRFGPDSNRIHFGSRSGSPFVNFWAYWIHRIYYFLGSQIWDPLIGSFKYKL